MNAPLSASASGAQLVRPRAMLRRCASACLHRSGRLRVHAPLRAPLRCFAAQRNEGDATNKSWSELAGEAAGLAKQALSKLVPAALTKKEEPPAPVARVVKDDEPDLTALLKPIFGDGLLGRAAGALIGRGVKAVASQLRSAAAQTEAVHAQASALVEADARVAAALGSPVRCGPPFAVSSSSQSINGVTTSSMSLQMMVEGATGRVAPVEVQESNGRTVTRVRLPQGDVTIDGRAGGGRSGSGGGAGQIIDVEARDVR